MSALSHRFDALVAELRENERTLSALVSTAQKVLDSESDESDVACASREFAALHMARLITALVGTESEAPKLRAVK